MTESIRRLFETVRRPDGKAWTLQEVAQRTGLSVSYIWRLRSGRATNPTTLVLERLADFFGVPVSYFVGTDDTTGVDQHAIPQQQKASPGHLHETERAHRVHRLLAEARRYYSQNRFDEAERTVRKAIEDANSLADRLLAGRGLVLLARVLLARGRAQEAGDIVSEALGMLGGPKAGITWVQAVLVLSNVEYLREHFSHAYFHARRALAAIELGEGDEELHLQVLYFVGVYARRVGRTEEAIVYLERARPLSEKLGEKYLAAVLLALGLAYLDADQAELALERFQEALTLYRRGRTPSGVARAQHNMGLAYEKLGRWQEAIESLTKSLGSNEALGDMRVILYDHMELGWCYANIGQREMALRHAYAALALAQEHDWAGDRARAHWHLGRVLAALGEKDEAASHYEKAIQLLEELELEAELPRVQLEFGDLLVKQGEVGRAAELFRKAATTLMHTPSLQRHLLATPPVEIRETELTPEWNH